MDNLNVFLTGVGGQGVILASDILSQTALSAGYDVKKTDTIGMAQRGGSVVSHIRIAPQIWSPLIKEGEADILLGFEKLETARWGYYLRPGGTVIVNNQALPPPSVITGANTYPADERIASILRQRTQELYTIDAMEMAREIGNARTYNTLLLGCLSVLTPFEVGNWHASIAQHLAANLREVNLTAFNRGREEMNKLAPESSRSARTGR